MADGFGSHGACFATTWQARLHACGQDYPQAGSDAGGSFVVSCTGLGDGEVLELVRSASGGASSAYTVQVTPSPCSINSLTHTGVPTSAQFAAAFAWGFSGVLILYCIAWGAGRVLAAIGR